MEAVWQALVASDIGSFYIPASIMKRNLPLTAVDMPPLKEKQES